MPVCRSCGVDLRASAGVCPACCSAQHPDDSPFGQMENKLRGWKLASDAGMLAPAVLKTRIGELQLVDRDRQRWWLDADGGWNRWVKDSWQPADPSSSFRVRPAPRRWRWVGAGCGLGAIILLGLVAFFLFAGWQGSHSTPVLVEDLDPASGSAASYPLSSDQQQVLDELGSPEAFSMLFYDQPDASGAEVNVRQETWTYYSSEMVIAFTDGREVRRDPLVVDLDGQLAEPPAQPQDFTAYMTLEDVVGAAGLTSYLAVPLEEAYAPAAAVYYAEGLTFGLVRGELRYLEALAVIEEGGR